MWATASSSTGPERNSGGAAKASPSPVRRTRTSPAAHSWITAVGVLRRTAVLQPRVAGAESRVARERQLDDAVKMRTR